MLSGYWEYSSEQGLVLALKIPCGNDIKINGKPGINC